MPTLAAQSPTFSRKSQQLVLSVFMLVALTYLLMLPVTPYPLHWLHKAAPILLLAGVVFYRFRQVGLYATLALLFSAAGDVLLALPLTLSFELGLGAFLIGHLFYTVIFTKWLNGKFRPNRITLLVAVVLPVCGVLILPHTGDFWLPVALYMLVISVMALTATLLAKGNELILLGAVVFVLSDTLIAINKFVVALPYSAHLIMITYYAAQLMLFVGISRQLATHANR